MNKSNICIVFIRAPKVKSLLTFQYLTRLGPNLHQLRFSDQRHIYVLHEHWGTYTLVAEGIDSIPIISTRFVCCACSRRP